MRDSAGVRGGGIHMYVHNQCPQPLHTGLAAFPIPDGCGDPSAAMGITVSAHPDLAWLLGYLPDSHGDGRLTPGKPHSTAPVLGAGTSKSIPTAVVRGDSRGRLGSWRRQGGPNPIADSGLLGTTEPWAAGDRSCKGELSHTAPSQAPKSRDPAAITTALAHHS